MSLGLFSSQILILSMVMCSVKAEQECTKEEAADVLFHYLVLLEMSGMSFAEVLDV